MKYNTFNKSQAHQYESVIVSTDAYLGLYSEIFSCLSMSNADLLKQQTFVWLLENSGHCWRLEIQESK